MAIAMCGDISMLDIGRVPLSESFGFCFERGVKDARKRCGGWLIGRRLGKLCECGVEPSLFG